MDLQSLFYLVSILFILGWLVFLIILLVASLILFKRMNRVTKVIEEKADSTVASILLPLLPVGLFILSQVKNRFTSSKD